MEYNKINCQRYNRRYIIFYYRIEEDDFDEAILLDDLPANLRENSSNINIESNDDEEPKEGNSNQKNISLDFLNECAIKISKDKRLNIGEKLKIIELNKNDPIKFCIHKLSNILNISRSTIRRWIQNDIQFQTIENTKKLIYLAKVQNHVLMSMKKN